ncbi:MAG: DUF6940 family protein [Planctomycetales bacterium]
MAWRFRSQKTADGRGLRFTTDVDGAPVSYAQVLRCWGNDAEFRSLFLDCLANAPYAAYRWETPPITAATASRPFEFVILDSPGLARTPSDGAFAQHFDSAATKRSVVEFPNLGRDAILVAPCPQGASSAYGHLAAFVREAPVPQQHALWTLVGEAMERRLGISPVWLSTAGAGVPWLHVRLDNQPKYYGHAAYRVAP